MDDKLKKLKGITAEISALRGASAVLGGPETYMPPGGTADRANQLSLLARLAHERMVSDELGHLLDDLQSDVAGLDPDSDEARLVSVTKRDYDLAKRVPGQLIEDISRASSEGITAWRKARAEKDYSISRPALNLRNCELNCALAQAIDPAANPYDALLSQYEPGIDTRQLEKIFSDLKAAIGPLVEAIKNSPNQIDNSILRQEYDEATQIEVALSIVEQFGYDISRGGSQQVVPHPFCTEFRPGMCASTTRVFPDFLNMALFATMHESGHGMYEQAWHPITAILRWPMVLPAACTSRSSACGRTSSAQSPLLAGLPVPQASGHVPRATGYHGQRDFLPGDKPRAALAHSSDRRRGDLQSAHHPALRVRERDARGQGRYRSAWPRPGLTG